MAQRSLLLPFVLMLPPLLRIQAARPSAIIDLIRSAEQFRFQQQSEQRRLPQRTCDSCGFISSQPVCKVGWPEGQRRPSLFSQGNVA